jgi:protein gp37
VTAIEWTDRTWNPVRGCSRVSEGCRNCYAERIAARFSGPGEAFHDFAKVPEAGGAAWTGKVALIPEKLDEPLRWRKPSRVFVNSMSDLFHEKLSDADIDRVFAVMACSPRHTFQVLTKRPERMRAYIEPRAARPFAWWQGLVLTTGDWGLLEDAGNAFERIGERRPFPLPNVWLGVSVEDQPTADERIPLLMATPAAVRFVSYEPALGPVNFEKETLVVTTRGVRSAQPLYCAKVNGVGLLDWIIYGGESGPGARPNDIAWARATRDACKAAGVAFFCKQLGAKPTTDIRTRPAGEPSYWTDTLRDRKGGDPAEWPKDLRVREFPKP